MTGVALLLFLMSRGVSFCSAGRVVQTFTGREDGYHQPAAPGEVPEGIRPTAPGSHPKSDIWTQLQYLHYGGDILIPILTEVMETFPVTFSMQIDWSGRDRRQVWNVSYSVTGLTEGSAERTVRSPMLSLDWRKELAPDGNGVGILGSLRNLNKDLVLQIRQLHREPESNLQWLRPDGCTKSKPSPKRVFCLHPPSATRSDPCVYTVLESKFGANYFVYKSTQFGQELVLQSLCSAYKKTPDSCSFHAGACPGRFDDKTNPLGYRYTSLGGVSYYQDVSDVWMSDEFEDITLLLSLSSIFAEWGAVQPKPFSCELEDPVYIESRDKAIAQATPTFVADDISSVEFLQRLLNTSWQLGGVGEALTPKMVMPNFGALVEYTVHELQHGRQEWWVGHEGLSKPVKFAQLDWDGVQKPKKMIVKSHDGKPIFWIKQSGEAKGSPKWRIPEECHLTSRPKASSNRFFCVVPPDSDEHTPCLFTFQKSKFGQNTFVFRGPDMLYQMFCVGSGYSSCYFSEQSCPGTKYDWVQRAQLEMAYSNQIKVKVFPGQDTGLFLTIASMVLHKQTAIYWYDGLV